MVHGLYKVEGEKLYGYGSLDALGGFARVVYPGGENEFVDQSRLTKIDFKEGDEVVVSTEGASLPKGSQWEVADIMGSFIRPKGKPDFYESWLFVRKNDYVEESKKNTPRKKKEDAVEYMGAYEAMRVLFTAFMIDKPMEVQNKSGNRFRLISEDKALRLQKKQPHQEGFHDIGHLPFGKYTLIGKEKSNVRLVAVAMENFCNSFSNEAVLNI